MQHMAIIFFVVLSIGLTGSAHASSQADAREVARINNCPPKKIEVYQQSLGSEARTVYRVECNMPKATDDTNPGVDALLISCQDSLCTLLRPVSIEKK